MDTKNVNIKEKFLLGLITIGILVGLSNCGCPPFTKDDRPEIELPNLVTVLNPKDTFDVGDTLWFSVAIPVSFYGKDQTCELDGNTTNVYLGFGPYFTNSNPLSSVLLLPVVDAVNQTYTNEEITLIRQDFAYKVEFGVILNDASITEIAGDTSNFMGSALKLVGSYEESPCSYFAEGCDKYFDVSYRINTSFQGGVKRWKINMRQ